MSKVVFLGFPEHGHTNPTIGVVKELISRGEEVFYFSTPELLPKIRRMGANFCDYRISQHTKIDFRRPKIDISALNQIGKVAFNRMELYFRIMENQKQDLKEKVMEIKPDYLIHDSCANWGKILAKQLGIPAISSITTFAYNNQLFELHPDFVIRNIIKIPEQYVTQPQDAPKIARRITKKIADLFHIPDYDVFDIICAPEAFNIVYTSREFQFFAEAFDSSFKFVGPSISLRQDPGDFPVERLTDKPLIYISLGTVNTDNPAYPEFYRKCFEAFANSDKQVVVARGNVNPLKLGRVPKNFIVRKHVPQLEILKKASLFVTHGGMNSVNEALYFNVPMIVIPQRVDQFMVAERAGELGVGIELNKETWRVNDLTEAAAAILSNDAYRREAQKIGESLRATGGARQAADEIFQFKLKNGIQ